MANCVGGICDGPLNVKMTAANGEILYDVVPTVVVGSSIGMNI